MDIMKLIQCDIASFQSLCSDTHILIFPLMEEVSSFFSYIVNNPEAPLPFPWERVINVQVISSLTSLDFLYCSYVKPSKWTDDVDTLKD